jgi:hypothetical protein
MTDNTTARRRRVAVPAVIAGAASALVLAFSMTPTFAALTAAITNSTDTAGAGVLTMQESNQAGTVLCDSTTGTTIGTNSATCATINKFGGDTAMYPGETVSTTITIKNTGTVPATVFSLVPSACTPGNSGTVSGTATDICDKIRIEVKSGATTVFTSATATSFGSGGSINVLTKLATASIAGGASVPFTFNVTLDSTVGNTYQGKQISIPIVWNFQA